PSELAVGALALPSGEGCLAWRGGLHQGGAAQDGPLDAHGKKVTPANVDCNQSVDDGFHSPHINVYDRTGHWPARGAAASRGIDRGGSEAGQLSAGFLRGGGGEHG